MIETNYRISKNKETFLVSDYGKTVAQGCIDIESALHAIWVLEGKQSTHYYHEEDGVVLLEEK